MRTSLIIVSLVAATLVAGTIIHLNGRNAPIASAPVAEPKLETQRTRPLTEKLPSEALPQAVPDQPFEPASIEVATPALTDAIPEAVVQATPHPTPFSRAIDTLVSPQASFQTKYETWRQLQAAGQLDEVIEALSQGATEHPSSAAYPAALGQAQLYKAGEVARQGGAISEMGILGMQADQNFDAALNLDPVNWEAQFFKAAAMSHWPLELNKGDEVIQRLSHLIDQQDALLPQPQFAQPYVVLGDQYQKMGQPDYAAATWRIGAQKYPGNPELQQKTRGN